MRLTRYTDYALRVLIQVGLSEGELVQISEIASAFGVSRNHLTKIVHQLGAHGYLKTIQGRHGGVRLACPPSEIVIGEVIRNFEGNFDLVDCFNQDRANCRIQPACTLKYTLANALAAFLGVLDETTVLDLLKPRHQLRTLLDIRVGKSGHRPVLPQTM